MRVWAVIVESAYRDERYIYENKIYSQEADALEAEARADADPDVMTAWTTDYELI